MELKCMIAEWVRQARTEAGMSGAALGAKLALELGTVRGHTRANISHWETQKHSPNLQQMLAISKVTGKALPSSLLTALQVGDSRTEWAATSRDQAPQRTQHPGESSEGSGGSVVDVSPSRETSLDRLDAEEKALLEFFRSATRVGKTMILGAASVAPKDESLSIGRPN